MKAGWFSFNNDDYNVDDDIKSDDSARAQYGSGSALSPAARLQRAARRPIVKARAHACDWLHSTYGASHCSQCQPVPVTATTRPTGVADVDGVAGAGIGERQSSSAGAARTNGPMNVRVFVLGRGLASFPYHEIRLSSKRYLGSHSLTPTKYHHVIPILYTLNDETSPLTTMPLVTRSLQQSTVNML